MMKINNMMKIEIEAGQIQGKRNYQQDAYGYRDLSETAKIFILADGMGGYKGGEIASDLVVQTFMKESLIHVDSQVLMNVVEEANAKIENYKVGHADVSQMGTTLIALAIENDHYQWISIGDSPLYRIYDNKIERINQNHSVAGLLDLQVQQGEISQEKAQEDTNRHLLTSALTGEGISMIDQSESFKITPNEILLLASDGVETLSEKEILELMSNDKNSPKEKVQELLKSIEKKAKSHQDNATVVMLSFSSETKRKNPLIAWIKRIIK